MTETAKTMRMCAGCRQRRPITELVQVATSGVGQLSVIGVAGLRERPGRALHCCANVRCAQRTAHRAFGRKGVPVESGNILVRAACAVAERRLINRRNGLRRRRLSTDDAVCGALVVLTTQLSAASYAAGHGA